MTQGRLLVHLLPEEMEYLALMVKEDVRVPRDQIRWLIVMEARRRGYPGALAPETGSNPQDLDDGSVEA